MVRINVIVRMAKQSRQKWIAFWGCAVLAMAVSLFSTAPAYAQDCGVPTTSGLASYWTLDETSSPAVDTGSAGNNGTWVNTPVPTANGQINGALEFDRVNHNYVEVTNVGDMYETAPFTFATWVKFDQLGSDVGERIKVARMVHSVSPWHSWEIYLGSTDDVLTFQIRNSGAATTYNLDSDAPLTTGVWYHIAGTLDSSYNSVLYINGVAQVDVESTGSIFNADGNLRFGGSNGFNTNLDGTMDDVRFYSRALSAEEIKQLYKYGLGDTGAMIFNADNAALEYCDGTNWRMAGLGSYNPNGVIFDGTNDWLSVNGAGEGNILTKATGSFWVKRDAGGIGINQPIIWSEDSSDLGYFRARFNMSNGFNIDGRDFSGVNSLQTFLASSNTITADGEWHHVLFSLDVADNTKRHLYIDGVNVITNFDDVDTDFGYGDNINIGAEAVTGNNRFHGSLSNFWFDDDLYLDLSVAENRRKFISDNGMPTYLGPDGSLPTGNVPDIFLSGDTENWHTNKGTATGFTENGAIVYSSSRPGNCESGNGLFAQINNQVLPRYHNSVVGTNDGHLFTSNYNDGFIVYSFDGSTTTEIDRYNTADFEWQVWTDGIYLYGGTTAGNVHAFAFDGASLTLLDTYAAGGWIRDIWSDGDYLYVAAQGSDLHALTFDGTSFAVAGTYSTASSIYSVTGDGTYIYANETTQALALEFDGASFTLLDTIASGDGAGMDFENGYLYVAADANGVIALQFNGISFSSHGTYAIDSAADLYADGNHVFVTGTSGVNGVLAALTHDGSSFTLVDSVAVADDGMEVWGDGTYIHAAFDYDGLFSYSGFETCDSCGVNASGNFIRKGQMNYNTDYNTMQYCNGVEWVAMGPVGGTPPTNGLVAYYALDETSGATIADSAGANTGTWTDADNNDVAEESVSGKVLTAIDFDGTDDMISLGSPAALDDLDLSNNGMTLSAWIYARTIDADRILQKGVFNVGVGEGDWMWRINSTNSLIFHKSYNTTNLAVETVSNVIQPNTWHHVLLTWDGSSSGSNVHMYVDGQEVSYITQQDGVGVKASDAAEQLYIGSQGAASSTRTFDGYFDEVYIYDRLLSAHEIQLLYNYGLSGGLGDVNNGCADAGPITGANAEGQMFYNIDFNIMQYCNGEEWIGIGQ